MICHRCEEPNPRAVQRTNESSVWATAEPSFLPVGGQRHPQTAAIKPSHQLRPHHCWGTAQSCIYLLKVIDFSCPLYPRSTQFPCTLYHLLNSPRLAVAYRDTQKSIKITRYVSKQGRAAARLISPLVLQSTLLPAQLVWRQYVSPLSNNVILSQAAGLHSALSFLLCGFSNSDANSLLNILPPQHVEAFFFPLQPPSTRRAPASGWLRPAPIVHIVIFMSRAWEDFFFFFFLPEQPFKA